MKFITQKAFWQLPGVVIKFSLLNFYVFTEKRSENKMEHMIPMKDCHKVHKDDIECKTQNKQKTQKKYKTGFP